MFWFLSGATSVYAAPPTSVTLSPINLTATSATLRGSVNPNGKSTIVDFASALPSGNPGYFSPVPSPPQNIGSGVSAVLVTYTLTGLTPSTEYRYVVRASNADGSQNGAVAIFFTSPATVQTDWAVVSVGIQPPSPGVGTPVTLGMTMVALSTNGGYPQNVAVQCTLDGTPCGTGVVTYPGPTGALFTVTAATQWTATAGTHTLSWTISTSNDPNSGNNFGSRTFTVAAPPAFDFDITASPNALPAQPGQTLSAAVNVILKSGAAQPVTLTVSGQPGGVTASLNPTSGNPPFTSTLTVVLSSTVAPGTYPLTISGSGGGQTDSAIINLLVTGQSDFELVASPFSQVVTAGQTASYALVMNPSFGFNSIVSLAISGLPAGVTGSFNPQSGTPPFTSVLTLTLTTSVPAGNYAVTITASGGGKTHSATVALGVLQSQQPPVQPPAPDFLAANWPFLVVIVAVAALVIGLLIGRAKPHQASSSPAHASA